MKKIKIFVDGHWFDDLYQSMCVFLKGLYQELVKDDQFDIYIAAKDTETLRKIFQFDDRFKYVQYKSHSKYYRLSIDAPTIIKKNKIDVCHFQYVLPLYKSCKEIVTIHDILFNEYPALFPWQYRISKNLLFKQSAKRADLITTVSEYSCNSIKKHYKIPDEKIVITPNGISNDFFNVMSPNLDSSTRSNHNLKDYILYVSRIEPRKNHLFLLKAYIETNFWKKDIKLVFVGRSDIEVKELNQFISTLPGAILNNIVWLKDVNFKNLLDLYYNTSLFIYPSIAEGFGIPPLEAAALGVNTLCSNSTAMSDFQFFGNNLFSPHDLNELVNKIHREFGHKDENRLKNISDVISVKYNWGTVASAFAEKVKNLVS